MGCDDHNAGTTWINFVWNAPTGYSDFEVTFDGETESISRNSYFASGLNRGTPYRFSVKTEASGGRLSSAVSVTVEATCGSVGTACSIGSDGVLYLFFGDGIHRVDLEIAPGTYEIGSPEDSAACEWERLANLHRRSGRPERRLGRRVESHHRLERCGVLHVWMRNVESIERSVTQVK